MTMVQGFLLVVLLAGSSWSLPTEIDSAMIDLGQSEMNLRNYWKAVRAGEGSRVKELRGILTIEYKELQDHIPKLEKLTSKPDISSFARLLIIRVSATVLRINEAVGFNPSSEEGNLGNNFLLKRHGVY